MTSPYTDIKIHILHIFKNRQNYKLNHVFASSASALAAYAGCLVTRVAARAAFDKKRRSMLATDVIEELGDTMQRLFPVEIETDI